MHSDVLAQFPTLRPSASVNILRGVCFVRYTSLASSHIRIMSTVSTLPVNFRKEKETSIDWKSPRSRDTRRS